MPLPCLALLVQLTVPCSALMELQLRQLGQLSAGPGLRRCRANGDSRLLHSPSSPSTWPCSHQGDVAQHLPADLGKKVQVYRHRKMWEFRAWLLITGVTAVMGKWIFERATCRKPRILPWSNEQQDQTWVQVAPPWCARGVARQLAGWMQSGSALPGG